MKKYLKDLLTAADGETYTLIKSGIPAGLILLTGMQAWAIFRGQAFDAQGFGIAVGAMLGLGGIGIGASAKAEPNQALDGSQKP